MMVILCRHTSMRTHKGSVATFLYFLLYTLLCSMTSNMMYVLSVEEREGESDVS